MAELTISLDEETVSRLREIAQQRGESPEQVLASWAEELAQSSASASHKQKRYSTLNIGGILTDVEPLTDGNEEIDRLIAEEAINPHDDE